MFKKILVPVDGSLGSQAAFTKTVEIARANKSEVIVLNVTMTAESFWRYSPYGHGIDRDDLVKIGEKVIADSIKDAEHQDINITTRVKLGSPELEILEEACLEKVDLIIMGSRGLGVFAGTLLGRVSERVLKMASCPVLIIKDPNTIKEIECDREARQSDS